MASTRAPARGVTYSIWYYDFNPTTQAVTGLTLVPSSGTTGMDSADGIQVTVNKTFDAYLARIVGRPTLSASATALGQVSRGACEAGSGGTGVLPDGHQPAVDQLSFQFREFLY